MMVELYSPVVEPALDALPVQSRQTGCDGDEGIHPRRFDRAQHLRRGKFAGRVEGDDVAAGSEGPEVSDRDRTCRLIEHRPGRFEAGPDVSPKLEVFDRARSVGSPAVVVPVHFVGFPQPRPV